MKPEMSEFSYGYALTSELVHYMGNNVAAAPVFPSLYAEGQKGGGYDVKIPNYGTPVFLQFKLSHFMDHANCKENDTIGRRYYRWHLHPLKRSDQHNLLLELESGGNTVFYAAPKFHETAELNDYYLNNEIISRSAFFKPSDIGLLDDDEHYVVFNDRQAYRCSDEPKEAKLHSLTAYIESLHNIDPRPLDSNAIIEIGNSIERSITEAKGRRSGGYRSTKKDIDPDVIKRMISEKPSLQTLGVIARTVLDLELMIVPAPKRNRIRHKKRGVTDHGL